MTKNKDVVYALLNLNEDGSYEVKSVRTINTGIGDPKTYALYKKLEDMDYRTDVGELKKWKGERFGSRLEYDESDKIGDSYAKITRYKYVSDTVYVYEMYNSKN